MTSHTVKLTEEQGKAVQKYLVEQGYQFSALPHARYSAKKLKTNVVFYESGKLVVQGKGTQEFVEFFLEPKITQQARVGYETILNPRAFEPHVGVDESGKGDYFGPLVVSAVFVDSAGFEKLRELGVKDSKKISTDKRIQELAKGIKKIRECVVQVVPIGPEAYNRLHQKMKNVNDILGWGHARAIENVLQKLDSEKPPIRCTRAIADQFGNKRIIERALMERGKKIELEQRHRAEEDLAVAAASIIARSEFVERLGKLSHAHGVGLPKGASQAVIQAGRDLVEKDGDSILEKVAKLHFQTTQKVLAKAV